MDLAEQVIQIRGSDADGNEAEQARFPGQPQRARPSHTGGSGAVAWTKKKPLAVWRGAPTGAVGSAASVKAAISVRWNLSYHVVGTKFHSARCSGSVSHLSITETFRTRPSDASASPDQWSDVRVSHNRPAIMVLT